MRDTPVHFPLLNARTPPPSLHTCMLWLPPLFLPTLTWLSPLHSPSLQPPSPPSLEKHRHMADSSPRPPLPTSQPCGTPQATPAPPTVTSNGQPLPRVVLGCAACTPSASLLVSLAAIALSHFLLYPLHSHISTHQPLRHPPSNAMAAPSPALSPDARHAPPISLPKVVKTRGIAVSRAEVKAGPGVRAGAVGRPPPG